MERKYQFILIGIIVFLSSVVLYVTSVTLGSKTQQVEQQIYKDVSEEIKKHIELLINNKKQSTLSIALSLSRDQYIVEALQKKNTQNLGLDELSSRLKEFTRFKNVWFQVIDKKGKSIYRSWTDKRGDLIYKTRAGVQQMLQKPQVMSIISVGYYDMTFKSMVPVYDTKNNFLGFFEIITHFNSISRTLAKDKYKVVILADKKYHSQLKYPFTQKFIDEYYIANLDASEKYLKVIENKGIEKFLSYQKDFEIDRENNYFYTLYNIPNVMGEDMGYILIFKELNDIAMDKVQNIQKNIIISMIFIILVIVIVGYYIFNRKYNTLLEKSLHQAKEEKDRINAIMSAQPYIILIAHENRSLDVNDKFFEFFDKYKSLKEFKKENDCICDLFVQPEVNDGSYLYNKKNWIDTMLKNPEKEYKCAIYKHEKLYHFVIHATKPKIKGFKDNFVIVTFVDITQIKQKDQMLFEQSKNASMGEMIGNIAHQWRQPLSVISTAATGMLLQKQIDQLTDEKLEEYCDNINENAQYLSKTIDDFRDFIKGETKLVKFDVQENLQKLLVLINPVAKNNNIELSIDVDRFYLHGYPNQLLQCYLNIFNNSKDAFKNNAQIKDKMINIYAKKVDNKLEIVFEDNAGGIPNDIISKVFEPYFTTKHQSQGTGLGLHMTYSLVKQMGGNVTVHNFSIEYKGVKYTGARFTITFKLD